MSSYQPFPIYDFRSGLQLDREPWLLPGDAFMTMENAYLFRGVLCKRLGYSLFADTEAGFDIVGIFNYIESNGAKTLMVADTRRLYEYNTGTKVLDDKDGSDYYTGTGANFISSCNYKSKVYMANNKDQCRSYNGATVGTWKVDISGDTFNDLDFCLLIMYSKRRIILLRTSEDGTLCPQRARWCTVDDPDDWDNDEYVDAPTSEWIRGAAYSGDDIIVFFDESVWMLKYTGNETLPFRWERISATAGCAATFSVVDKGDEVLALEKTGLVFADALGVKRADDKIPDVVLNFNADTVDLVCGALYKELRHVWWSYPSLGASKSDRVLVLNYDDWSFSIYKMSLSCLGFFSRQESETWASTTGTWAEQVGPWVKSTTQLGYPTALGGTSDGKVYLLNDTPGDAGLNIAMNVKGGYWNPFMKSGKKARLGYIDFLIECNEAYELTVDFFMNFNSTPYQSKTLSFDHPGSKAWTRIHSGAIGTSHGITIRDDSHSQQPKIHAITPYFKPAGRLTLDRSAMVTPEDYLKINGDFLTIGGERLKK